MPHPTRPSTDSLFPEDEPYTPHTAFNGQDGAVPPPSPPPAGPVSSPPDDDWDLDALRVSQDFEQELGVQQVVTEVKVQKPDKSKWVRTHPDPDYSIETLILELREERELYIVSPRLHAALVTEPTVGRMALVTAMTRQGRLFLWPIRLASADGKTNDWNETARNAARRGRSKWVRIAADMAYGNYRVWEAQSDPEPKWPAMSFQEILKMAFADKRIQSLDHPIIRRLQKGE